MALLWADGFDHYGSDETNMLDGAYGNVTTTAGGTAYTRLDTAQFATGTHSYCFHQRLFSEGTPALRKVLPTSKNKLGLAARYYFTALPTSNFTAVIAEFLTSEAARGHISVVVDSNGAFRIYRGTRYDFTADNGTLIATSDPMIVAAAWNHVEIQVYFHDTDGWIRIRVNGYNTFSVTGLDTKYNSDDCHSVGFCNRTSDVEDWYLDDLYIYDFVGDSAVDTDFVPTTDVNGVATNFIGELQCIYRPMDGDTAEDDWVPSTGTDAFAMVDETTPNDADYISSTAAGDLSEFTILDLPEDITYIRGVQLIGRMSKSDSGTATITFGMKSDAATDDADARSITVEPTYWWDFMNVDPDSGARWTKASLDAAWFRLTRVS